VSVTRAGSDPVLVDSKSKDPETNNTADTNEYLMLLEWVREDE